MKKPSTKVSQQTILFKLDEIHRDVSKNTKDIEQLKEEVAMGKGGIRAIFVIGSLIGLVVGGYKLFNIGG
jgi:glutamine synthetase adenylyltransferase